MPSLSSTAKLHISVQDVDDQNPKFLHERYSATINADTSLVQNFCGKRKCKHEILFFLKGSALEIFPDSIEAHDMDTLNSPMVYSLSGSKENFDTV